MLKKEQDRRHKMKFNYTGLQSFGDVSPYVCSYFFKFVLGY